MGIRDIEIGTTQALSAAGRDLAFAVHQAADTRLARYVARDGERCAVILPCGPEDSTPNPAELDAAMGHIAGRMTASYKPEYKPEASELIGLALGRYLDYDGDAILAAAATALEDANWHDAAAELRGMITAEG